MLIRQPAIAGPFRSCSFAMTTSSGLPPVPASASGRPPRYRTKVAAGLLAFLFGWMGAHWWYLGRRGAAWFSAAMLAIVAASQTAFESHWENPAFLFMVVPATAGFIEAIVLCLMADEKFNARYNPGLPHRAQMGWGPVILAGVTLVCGTIVTMTGIAMIVIYVWNLLGWFEGYTL